MKKNYQRTKEENQSFQTNLSINQLPTNLSTNYTIKYVTDDGIDVEYLQNTENQIDTIDFSNFFEVKDNDTFPIFLADYNSIAIPKKVKRNLQRLPKNVLLKIDSDKNVAVEKCLIAASLLTSTLFKDDKDKWKKLSSTILHEQLKKGNDNSFVYPYVIEALKYSTNSTNPIIESKINYRGTDTYENGKISKQYRFTPEFQDLNVVSYELKDSDCIDKRRKYYYKILGKAINNPIGFNQLSLYQDIQLPTMFEIENEASRLIKQNHRTKKGKILTRLNNKTKEHYSNYQNRSFVEDNIKLFDYLTTKGYMIPIIGDEKSGGRVVDSFNLMPSWIRKLCRIGNEEIIELDYSALHPNIALSLYEGKSKYLEHKMVSDSLGKDLSEVKVAHLSFFNKRPNDMTKSILFEYYMKNEQEMLFNILKDKKLNGYKNISRQLFKKEVEIMTSCIRHLNSLGIYVMYVYDALYCKKSDAGLVREVMNKAIVNHQVYTIAKQ